MFLCSGVVHSGCSRMSIKGSGVRQQRMGGQMKIWRTPGFRLIAASFMFVWFVCF